MADPHDDDCRCQGCCAAKFKKLDPAAFGKTPAMEQADARFDEVRGHAFPHGGDEWLRFVDVDIRSLIRDLNELPFVERTVHSCAGCGLAGDFPRNPADHPKDDPGHAPGTNGYVTIAYKNESGWMGFHRMFAGMFDWFSAFDKYDMPSCGYHLDGTTSEDEMRAKWERVRSAVQRYRDSGGTPMDFHAALLDGIKNVGRWTTVIDGKTVHGWRRKSEANRYARWWRSWGGTVKVRTHRRRDVRISPFGYLEPTR